MMKSKLPGSKPRAPQPGGPTLIPPTAGTCATCFYGRFIQPGDPPARLCRADRPTRVAPGSHYAAWPAVADDDWCGDGVDATTYGPFAPDWY